MRNNKIKTFLKAKAGKYLLYFMLMAITVLSLWFIIKFVDQNNFFEVMEHKTLDLRYNLTNGKIKHNSDIIILAIDDASLETLQNDYGIWPLTRDIYAKAINYLEKDNVDSIIFDLMFVGYQKNNKKQDIELAKTISSNDNVFTAMNFTNTQTKKPPKLPDGLKLNTKLQSKKYDFSNYEFDDCQLILPEIISSTDNIGFTNIVRSKDGIIRKVPLVLKYQGDFYPYLGFKAALAYINKHEKAGIKSLTFAENNTLKIGQRTISVNNDGTMILNWYGPQKTFEYISFGDVIRSYENQKQGMAPVLPKGTFKNKIVFVGMTATSMFDIKSVPLSSIYPGVEVQATTLNNILDASSVKPINKKIDILTCIILSIITGILVLRIRSVLGSLLAVLLTTIFYIVFAGILFQKYFIWIGLVNEIITVALSIIIMYIYKYLLKSRDFDHTYKLATTDGLTALYNHRYFQDSLADLIKKSEKQPQPFSLLIVDIDFFKKFNDTYGHQAGDEVLRKTADLLKKSVKSSDVVARYGGEEMVIILKKTNKNEAIIAAERICRTVAAKTYVLGEGVETNVTISLGVATYPEDGISPQELIEFADKGLYHAKQSGRNRVGIYEKK